MIEFNSLGRNFHRSHQRPLLHILWRFPLSVFASSIILTPLWQHQSRSFVRVLRLCTSFMSLRFFGRVSETLLWRLSYLLREGCQAWHLRYIIRDLYYSASTDKLDG